MRLAVLFDLDNTLVDRDGAFEQLLEQFFEPEVRQHLRDLDRSGQGPRTALFAAWEKYSGQTLNQTRFGRLLASKLTPDPKLLDDLRVLSQTYKLGLISNGGSATQRSKLRASGLDQVFDPARIWISGEVGLEKPDPRIFWLACQALEVEPESCLYLGDLEEIDGRGARAAGLQYQQYKPGLCPGGPLAKLQGGQDPYLPSAPAQRGRRPSSRGAKTHTSSRPPHRGAAGPVPRGPS